MSRRLSLSRAQSIVDYLIGKGISADRLKAVGYGAVKVLVSDNEIDKLKTPEEKELAHAKNRRTEFKILKTE
jgi:outer membrane protein OmpA-like peptidoglycan-associated protein